MNDEQMEALRASIGAMIAAEKQAADYADQVDKRVAEVVNHAAHCRGEATKASMILRGLRDAWETCGYRLDELSELYGETDAAGDRVVELPADDGQLKVVDLDKALVTEEE